MSENDTSGLTDNRIDTVRASRDGHTYHEAWAARSALELLPPTTSLHAIAIEGFEREDAAGLSDEAAEIADTVRYHGGKNVAHSTLAEVVQFKYSISKADVPVRAADLKKTLGKFAKTEKELREKHSAELVERVVRYVFATNRPVNSDLLVALRAASSGEVVTEDASTQLAQIKEAVGSEVDLPSFIRRFDVAGRGGMLREVETELRRVMASWTAPGDAVSEKRLLKLKSLVREKAGSAGQHNNLIDRVSVLAELEVDDEEDLYPTPASFPEVADVIARPIIEDIAQSVKLNSSPLVIHAAGGMGKTVLMQALADRLSKDDRVVLFDGFGAGRWRDPSDGRHRARRTLVHIANLLAGEGLCDILIASDDDQATLKALRQRLTAAIASVRAVASTADIVLVLDAIDHAGMAAEDMGGNSFGHLLLGSLAVQPIEGVYAVASCRSHRIQYAVGQAAHRELEVPKFTADEARQLILKRDPTVSEVEISALERRAGGNPRYLDTLLVMGRPYDWAPVPTDARETAVLLDKLLEKRFQQARHMALAKGASESDLNVVFSGLAMLPPPVPIAELAAAQGLSAAEVESLVADLAPLIERTPHGLMFRDEPTETLIREDAKEDEASRRAVIARLRQRQDQSDYAARALPSVLTVLNERKALFDLAFDDRVPPGASKISQRDIRLARILASLAVSARAGENDEVFQLLLEASIVAAGHQRSDRFLYEHPELAAVAGDSEALRRLFETKVGWPGGRHSALALANAFLGDMPEARRNANRAIDWFNWAAAPGHNRTRNGDRISTKWDDVGFAYALLLNGDESRVARWFAKRSEVDAFEKFDDLFELLERNASLSTNFTAVRDLGRKLQYCRLRSRAIYAAGLAHSDGTAATELAMLSQLAKCPLPDDLTKTPKRALYLAAAMAIVRNENSIAQTIFDGIPASRPSVHDFSSYWPSDRSTDRVILAAGIKAALSGKKVSLFDVAPREFVEAVPPSIIKRGPAAFARSLKSRLSGGTANQPHRKRRKSKYALQLSDDHERALTHRIQPLLLFADHIATILKAKNDATRLDAFGAAFDYLVERVAAASNYPYRDGKAYVARGAGLALFALAERVGTLDARIAGRIVAWLKSAPGFLIQDLMTIVSRLSRYPALQDAALDLAVHVEKVILQDTQTESRISSYGTLARAVWRVSPEEAASYFRRALDLAEAVGSDDFDRTNNVLELLSRYRGELLAEQSSFTFSRIVELNLYEPGKFPWVEYAQAMVPTAGLASIGTISRLDDRDVAPLSMTWGPMVTVLTDSGAIPVNTAIALFGLAEPREANNWHYHDFVRSALKHLPDHNREWLFEIVLIELDREDHLAPWASTAQGLRDLAREYLPAASPALARLEALAERCPPEKPYEPTTLVYKQEVFGVDLKDPDAIDAAIDQEVADAAGNRWPIRILMDLAQQPETPAARLAFVQALVAANEPSLADKMRALEDRIPDWSSRSAALKDALPQLGGVLAGKHAVELVSSAWEASSSWRILLEKFGADRSLLIREVVQSLASQGKMVGGDGWMALAVKLAPLVSEEAYKTGLERLLNKSAEGIPAEVGDGPWDPRFEISQDAAEVSAEFLWVRLGNPSARARWRATHAVRRLAASGQWEIIDRLMSRYDAGPPTQYRDAKLPFYTMHAQLWLIIAVARIAKDFPEAVIKYRSLLERVAFDAAFPHIIFQRFAAMALQELLPAMPASDSAAISTKIAAVNVSPFPREKGKIGRPNVYAARPKDHLKGEDAFRLEYDFHKYQASDVCDLFDRQGWEVEDEITRWVRSWDPSVHGMYECPRLGEGRYNDGSWSNGAPEIDRYGGYLGWHALMLTTGSMLATYPVTGQSWRGDPLPEFVREHSLSRADGYWLSDATDLFPLDIPKVLPMPEDEHQGVRRQDIETLSPMLKTGAPEGLVVAGSWEVDGTSVSVRTLLANADDAKTAMLAAMAESPFHRWLPHDRDVEREFGDETHSVRNWMDTDVNETRYLDRHDPYGSSRAMHRPKPESWLTSKYGLVAADAFVREWKQGDEVILSAQAWGTEGGKGDYHWEVTGDRISVSRAFLSRLLKDEGLRLVGLIKARKYLKNKTGRRTGGGSFLNRSAAFAVDQAGQVAFLNGIPSWVKKAAETIEGHHRGTFESRFVAFRKGENDEVS